MQTARATGDWKGDVLSVLRQLVADGNRDAILELVGKLVKRNVELERMLAETTSGRGRKNEGVSTAQLELLLEALAQEEGEDLRAASEKLEAAALAAKQKVAAESAEKPAKQPPLRRPPPPELRRVINKIPVPDAKRACPTCGSERECIGHDVTEVLDLIPAQVIVRVDQREKLACRSCEAEVVRAPIGDKVVEGGRMGSALVAELLVDKYHDGIPLNRSKQRFARMGLDVPGSTLADQVAWATKLLEPIWHAARDAVLNAPVMHLDATSLAVKDRDAEGGIKLGSLWGYVGGETALYLYASTAKAKGQKPGELGPEDFLALRTGYTVADAAGLFDASFKRPGIIECGCNMHARRYFVKALDRGDTRTALPLAAYKRIYELESETSAMTPEERLAFRREHIAPLFDEIVSWCESYQPHEPPSSSSLGAAIRYLVNHQIALRRFLDDGRIPLDNGVVERLHVRTALTRKNYLFAGSETGAERAAIAYTVIGSCKLADVNPAEYLKDVLPRLARGLSMDAAAELLPARWKATERASFAELVASGR